jgi:enoyl-CoA hydratase
VPHVALPRLDRPAKLNATNLDLIEGRWDAIGQIRRDPGWRAVIRTGTGQGFCAALNGPAVERRLGFALACDLRVAATEARFGAVFMKIRLSNCVVGVSYFLRRIIGAGRALELMLTARVVDAAEADRLGLVNREAAPDRLLESRTQMVGTHGDNMRESFSAFREKRPPHRESV